MRRPKQPAGVMWAWFDFYHALVSFEGHMKPAEAMP